MKRKFTPSVLFAFVVLCLSACGTFCPEPLPGEALGKGNTDQLVGEWTWLKTHNGWGGWETPASKGYQETLFLDKNAGFKRFRGGILTEERHYYISKEKPAVQGGDSTLFLHLVDKNKGVQVSVHPLYRFGADTMFFLLTTGCADCPEYYFVRRQAAAALAR
ncbi:MAG: hypothetical protein ACO1O1_07440 [Adhaeribacter sp.]